MCVQTLLVFEGVCIRAYVSGRVHRGACIGACAPWAQALRTPTSRPRASRVLVLGSVSREIT